MMDKTAVSVLAADMRALYGVIYKGDDWQQEMRSRHRPQVDYRHIVRSLVYRERYCTLDDVAAAEASLTGTEPVNHSTIYSSLRAVKYALRQPYRGLIHKLGFYYDARRSIEDDRPTPYLGKIAEFKREQEHVKDILLASLVEHGLVDAGIMRTLMNEYRHVDAGFLEAVLGLEE